MYAKIQIQGIIEVVTGMHIGGSSAFSAIGAVDSPVMKDVRTNMPMIPGSSLKGKMRTLLARSYNEHLSDAWDQDHAKILRLFGSAKKNEVQRGRVLFTDMILSNADKLREQGLNSMTEVKFENNISRTTSVANPRQIERVVRGAEFPLDLVYEVVDEREVIEDLKLLVEGMKLLKYDYLGGHGSRGYGRILFRDLSVKVVVGQVEPKILEQCAACVKEVSHE